eukprot:TRINITY_DN7974_c0_g1_i1.p1 TRINITY_DN7974_c0_g1~~TRINITY_DN7974_c0_g1_i1.p1  ORF type:complete len:377 (-),score=59.94 TRINITY_DN7974_c0_g1_i1:197-1327(-)
MLVIPKHTRGLLYRRSRARRSRLPVSSCQLMRTYAIADRYNFPKSEIELLEEYNEQTQRHKSENKKRNAIFRKNKQLRHQKIKSLITAPSDDIKYGNMFMKPPVQPSNPLFLTVSIVGIPNAGKSTFINRMLDQTISAVSPKHQTTREIITGIYTKDNTQIVFLDTPGFVAKDERKVAKQDLMMQAREGLEESDVLMVLLDAVRTIDYDTINFFRQVKARYENETKNGGDPTTKYILVLNKADLVKPNLTHDPIERVKHKLGNDMFDMFGDNVFKISSLTGLGFDNVQNHLESLAYPEEWAYAKEMKTDLSKLMIVEEIIKSALWRRLNQEVPYHTEIKNTGWTDLPNGQLRIDETIIVEKPAHMVLLHCLTRVIV